MKTSPPYEIESIKHIDKLNTIIEATNLNKEDIIITGSSCLALRNIRVNGDLDILVTKNNRDQVLTCDLPKDISLNSHDIYDHLCLSPKELIENNKYYDVVDGFKIIRPEIILSYKYFKNREKDIKDRHWIGEYINRSEDWDWNLLRESTKPRLEPPSTSIIEKGLVHLINHGIFSTINSTIDYFGLKNPLISEDSNRIRYVHSGELMFNQYAKNGDFYSYDIFPHSMPTNLSKIRKEINNFDKLIKNQTNLNTKRVNKNNFVFTDEKMLILNPKTFISFLEKGITQIPVVVTNERKKDFTSFEELNSLAPKNEIIDQEYNILQDSGFLPQIICWGSSRDLHDDIVNEFDQKYDHVFWDDYTIANINKFIELQYQVHFDNRNYGKSFAVERKKHLISQHEPIIRVVRPKAVKYNSAEKMFGDIESLKKKLRKRYRDKQSSHTPLPQMILHSPNSFDENVRLDNIIKKFGTKMSVS